ncbi:hypothetical protein [Sharpea azabuensis]|uniref:hypothetical protein n=1 Tax=Sharpea azabuensis TaxID=322505 RepID=UPI00156815E3|nr:hypothetical protein [Sharpea azabuensis]
MAKQLSMKQQIYQQIANKQVQEVLNKQREQETASLMADFNSWQQQRQDPTQLMADFDAWKQQNAAPQPKQTIPSIADTQPKRDLQAEAREYFANVRKERAAEEAEAKRVEEQQLKATINDYARQQQEENMLASNSASKKKELKVGKRPEATDFSSQVAARPVDRETLKGGKKWNESVNNTLNMLNNTRPMPVMGNDLVENEPIIPENYTRPETQEDMVNRWLSPDTKLTDDEKKAAKEYASAELQKVQYGPNKMPLLNTPEERQHYADMVNLINKTNGFTNFMSGAIEVPYNLADMVSDGARSVGNQLGGLGAAITDKLGVTEGATKRHNEQAEIANQFADQNEANMRQNFKNAQTQNPGAYTTGKIAGQTGMYMLTNPVFDGIAAGAGVESELAKFFINQGAQNVQDLVLDTAPTVRQLMEDGSTPEEVKREALNNILWNVAGNAVMGGLGAWAGNRAARKASDEAFRENVRAGADNLSQIANEIPGIEDVDNVVRNATRQAETAAQNIENLNKQIPNLPDYVTGAPTGAYDVTKNIEPESIKEATNIVKNATKSLADSPEMARNADEMATYVYDVIGAQANKIYETGDQAFIDKFNELTSYYENYAKAITQSNDIGEINDATRELKNAIRRFDTAAKKVDPSITKSFNNMKFNKQLDDFNSQLDEFYNAERKSQEAFDVVNELEGGNPNKVMAEEISKPKSDIITSDPIEPGKYEIPDTPENAPIDVPPVDGMKERGTSKHIRNAGTPMKMEGVADEVVADFEDNPDMYKVLKNADTKAKAEKIYAEADNPEIDFRDMLRRHDPAALPLGHQLAKDYSAAGNHEAAAQIYREMGEQLTKSGQFSQAAAISMMKNDPLTALNYAERQIDKLNENGIKQFGNKWKDFSLTDDEIKMFNDIAPGDEEAIKAAYDAIGARLGKEYPTTFMDKLLEGRKIAMLFNVRTNVRNVGANIPTLGLRWASDRVEAIGQNIAHLINPEIKVTQAVTGSGRQGRKLATEVFNSKEVQAMLKNQGGKYEIPELRNSLVQNKQMYKGTALSKWIDRVTDGGIQKVNEKLFGKKGVQSGLETIRNATYKMLDLGDSPFVKENFVERLGSYIKAQGIKNIEDIPEEAIQTAWEEAMKATYKDNSWAVQMLSGLKGGIEKIPGVGKALSQAAIPFLQAPGNIAARMIDYSPVKATKGIIDIISGTRANDVKAVSKGIEEAAKGLTGSGLILLGMRLRDSGIITGTYSDDKDQKAYEKQTGFKEFALHVGDKYFTYDWAQPFAEPLIIGTLLSDAINKSDEYDSDLLDYFGVDNPIAKKALGVAYEGGKASLNSWFNASPLQGLQELLSGGFNGTDIAQNIVDTGVSDFAGAFVPASVNAVAKSMDTTQRNTYDPSNKVSTFVNQQIAKIPKLSETLPAKYDTWGREMKYADSKAMATASRFIVPGDYSYDKSDKIDKEIMRLYEGTKGDAAVFPQVAPNKVGDKKLNNKEVSEYQKDMGTRSRQLAEEFINSDVYKDMEDANRVEVLSNMYGASKTITERDKFDKEPAESSRYKRAIEAYDKAGGGEKGVKAMVDYYTAKSVSDEAGLDADSNAAKAIQKDVQDGNMEAAQQKKDAAQQLPTLGLDKPGPTYTYYNAQKKIPNLTVEEFAKTYKSIDSNSNQGIAQDEIINYLNKQHISSESEAKKIWNAYGKSDWKSIPSLQDGTWKKKKK